jgi:hypothetical protein
MTVAIIHLSTGFQSIHRSMKAEGIGALTLKNQFNETRPQQLGHSEQRP